MEIEEIMDYCLSKKGANHLYKEEWEADLFRISDKMFALIGESREGRPAISLKCDPDEALRLREKYKDVIPGYHMNKQQWNTVYMTRSDVPASLMKKMIDNSYDLVLAKLPKKKQAEITGQ